MLRNRWTLRIFLALATIATVAVSARNLPAGFAVDEDLTRVEIDGVNYGTFDDIGGLNKSKVIRDASGNVYNKITLKRDFVTDPSLYLWAKNTVSEHSGLRDVHIIKQDESGREVGRYVLKLCQPLSWSMEAANPALGGFHEKVDLAVQKIEIY